MSRKYLLMSMAYGQAIILTLTVVNVFFPQYYSYTFIIFIAGMAVFMGLTMKRQLKHVTSTEAKEIKEGKRLFKADPKEIRELQTKDPMLIEEMKPMMKASLMAFLPLIIVFAWYPYYFGRISTIVSNPETELWLRIVLYLAGYEIPYAIITVINFLNRRAIKNVVQVLSSYEVYDRGILGFGLVIKFPIPEEYEVRVSPGRKFVELVKKGKPVVRYRMYAKGYSRLADIIKRYGNPKVYEVIK